MRCLLFLSFCFMMVACNNGTANQKEQNKVTTQAPGNGDLNKLFDSYWEERMQLYPLEATASGDSTHNDGLTLLFTDSFRDTLKNFYAKYLYHLGGFKDLTPTEQTSYDIFKREMNMQLEALNLHDNYMPFNQFWGLPLDMGQLGSGTGNQPFKTEKDYRAWISRAGRFSAWADSAIIYFKKGIATGVVLPKALVIKMIPQLKSLAKSDTGSVFFGPIKNYPSGLSSLQKDSITKNLTAVITGSVLPAYLRLYQFLETQYLPKARTTTGFSALPGGDSMYRYLVRYWTTTSKTPDEIYATGLSEVARIRTEMERIKDSVGFKGDLNAFFTYMKTDKRFMPYKKPGDVLAAFKAIQQRIEPNLKKMFGRTPKTAFEIRQTEAFRAASASAEYQQGTPDGKRPGIFYVPILDATTFNTTSGMESLFLHEAIPGHHYQISLQQENEALPKFQRFAWYGAMGEGWALYTESLGKELGLYTDPYQYMGALGDEIHRAIRLVVDVAVHTKGMTREQAIKYMTDNEAISTEGATAEIERYMAIPAQALSYKVGAMKIRELRNKYSQQLGSKFSLAAFHDELLKDGVMPLDVLERKMDAWAKKSL